ncbi:MAG TPA: hypothetical protein VNN62_02285 [Methylomirabilota bacterium]|jgi:hypothetical protein|nr:hypothetical protein [Methylomirabilota bacterium]
MAHTILGAAFLAQQVIENTALLAQRGFLSQQEAERVSRDFGQILLKALMEQERGMHSSDVQLAPRTEAIDDQ